MPLRRYRYKRGGQEYGPLDESVMRTLIASGELMPDDLVLQEDGNEWILASHLFVFPRKKPKPDRKEGYQVPPQLAHPPTKTELSMPWVAALIAVLLICAGVLVWSVNKENPVGDPSVVPGNVIPAPQPAKPRSEVDRSIEAMRKIEVPTDYDGLLAALESPPAAPDKFERTSDLVRWWTAYSILYEKYWNNLTQVQQGRIPSEVLLKWRTPWKQSPLRVSVVGGEVREVRPAGRLSDIPEGYYVVELQQGNLLNCVLFDSEELVARITKGSKYDVTGLRVVRIEDGEMSRLFPDERRIIIWYLPDGAL